jgi:hypothetical protein
MASPLQFTYYTRHDGSRVYLVRGSMVLKVARGVDCDWRVQVTHLHNLTSHAHTTAVNNWLKLNGFFGVSWRTRGDLFAALQSAHDLLPLPRITLLPLQRVGPRQYRCGGFILQPQMGNTSLWRVTLIGDRTDAPSSFTKETLAGAQEAASFLSATLVSAE